MADFRPRPPGGIRASLSRRTRLTHAPVPASSSGWSLAAHAGLSSRRKASNRLRRNSARAVSTRKALRPRGPTSESISRTSSSGSMMCALCAPMAMSHFKCAIIPSKPSKKKRGPKRTTGAAPSKLVYRNVVSISFNQSGGFRISLVANHQRARQSHPAPSGRSGAPRGHIQSASAAAAAKSKPCRTRAPAEPHPRTVRRSSLLAVPPPHPIAPVVIFGASRNP